MEKKLMTVKEVCEYTGWGETKARSVITKPYNGFTLRLGSKLYVNKTLFDKFLDQCAKENRTI